MQTDDPRDNLPLDPNTFKYKTPRMLMSYKSRLNYPIGICFKECQNRGELCKTCVQIQGKETNYKPYGQET